MTKITSKKNIKRIIKPNKNHKSSKKNKHDNIHKILINKGKFAGYENTFILSTRHDNKEYNINYLRKYLQVPLNISGNTFTLLEDTNPKGKPIFLFMAHLANKKYDHRFYQTPCYLLNILSKEKEVITNKFNLYHNFARMFPQKVGEYFAASMDYHKLNPSDVILKGKIYIFRPAGIGAFSGRDIVVLNDQKSLDQAAKIASKYQKCIVSEYITRPMLYDNKKFHIRAYLLASNIEGVFRTYLYDFYEIFTAEKPYIQDDWNNPDIHDTHLKSTGKYIMGPFDLSSENKKIFQEIIYPQMQDCLTLVSQLLNKHAKPYENSKNGFEIFGCDFMVRDESTGYKVVLLEVNEHTGLSMADHPNRKNDFSQKYFSHIQKYIIQPALVTGKYPSNYLYHD